MLLELMRFCGQLKSIGDEKFNAVLKKTTKKNQKEKPSGFSEGLCKVIRTERYQVTSCFASCCSK